MKSTMIKFVKGQRVMVISPEGKPYKVVTIKSKEPYGQGWLVEEINADGRYIPNSQLRELTPLDELL